MADDKTRQPNWTELERVCAVKGINQHFDALFSKFKGATMGAKKKEAVWQTVTDELNSSGTACCKRSVDQVKVMYKNVKARGKFKEGEKKKTGGGPAPKLTPAEEEVMVQIRDRPQVIGISGFDSDTNQNPSTSRQNTIANVETEMESIHEEEECVQHITGDSTDNCMQNTQMTNSGISGLSDCLTQIDELKGDNVEMEQKLVLVARIILSAVTPAENDTALAKLLNALQKCVTCEPHQPDDQDQNDEQDQAGDDEVETASKNIVSDMKDNGVHIAKVEKGSILITFRCSTISSLKNISKYFADRMYKDRLTELENALSKYVGSPVKLNINIVLETLRSALEQIEEDANNKSIMLTLQCKGSEGVKNAVDIFGNGSSTNALNNLSEALSKYVGQRVELHTTIDVDKLENDITGLKRQLNLGDQNSVQELPKRMDTSLNISTTEILPDETAPTESSPRSKHFEVPMVECTSSSYSQYTSPQTSLDSHQSTSYRQQLFAVRYKLPTGLAFDTEICKVHYRLPALTERFVHIRSWLEENDLSSDCELLTSQRATLEEIESCCFCSFAYRDASPPTMKLSALPCGCIEDDRTGYCIKVDDLWKTSRAVASACVVFDIVLLGIYCPRDFESIEITRRLKAAGCVTDMTYRVCTGKLKNGLVFVPALERYFRKGSFVFQTSFVAIAAKQMKEKLNMKRILIFQWNVSHGMSTQRATYDDKAILYISIHETKLWRHYQKYCKSRECGSRDAEGFNVNIELDEFAGDAEYLEAFRTIVMPIASEFNPEIVLFSGSFYDGPRSHVDHDLSPCGLSPECFGHMTSELMSLANGKVVLIAAVGYMFLSEHKSAEMCLKALLGKEITPIKEDQLHIDYTLPSAHALHDLESTIQIQLEYWPCLQSHLSTIQRLLSEVQKKENIRPEMAALKVNLRTALSFDTETCTIHIMRTDYTERLCHISSLLDRNNLMLNCKLIQSRRATLPEIVPYSLNSELLSASFPWRKPTLKLSGLPCGCIADGPTVDVLRAAGCIMDMAYMVGAGELKNGLVFVPASEQYFRKDSNAFQLSFAAIAAKQMKENLNMKRILIFELNKSHGMSTQRATYDDKAVLYISIYIGNEWGPYRVHRNSHECGSRNAEGFNVNIVLGTFKGDVEYLTAFRNIVMPIAREFNPEMVLVLGILDDLISPECVCHMTSELMSLANGNVVVIAEVGNEALFERESAEMCLKALIGKEVTPTKEYPLQKLPSAHALQDLERTIQIQLEYWPCLRSQLSTIHNLLSEAQKKENIRQEMAADSYNFRTALSFDIETCTEHSMCIDYTEPLDAIGYMLERNNLILNCKLLKSRRATLQEIEPYSLRSDVLSASFLRRKPTMKFRELPCGCIADVWAGYCIPVEVLRAVGSVTDIAYKVGTGELNNGLVFVTASRGYSRMDSDVFQLSFAAIAAKQMKEKLNMNRILIFQSIYPHDMSTQRATYDDKAILCISIYDDNPLVPYQYIYKPELNEVHEESHKCGSRNAKGFNVNIDLGRFPKDVDSKDVDYLAAFRYIVMPIAREFDPEIVLVLGKFDNRITAECLGHMTSELMSLVNGKVVLIAEVGCGYLSELESAEMCLKALLGKEFTPIKERQLQKRPSTHALTALTRTIQIQLIYWPCLQKYLSEIQNLLADDRLGGNVISDLYEEDKKTWERGRVSSLLGCKHEPSMVHSTDVRTTHDASD